jgi:glycosyltransferase involved in cell wall biosynthesis
MSPRFSIIVPIYKVEAFLLEAIQSVKSQSCGDWELLLVDDGSPDGCPALCDQAAEGDSRIQVIHQKNAGVSAARNAGMRQAAGEYLLFLDGDDRLAPDALSTLSQSLQQNAVDVVFFQHATFSAANPVPQPVYYPLAHAPTDHGPETLLSYLYNTYPDFAWGVCRQCCRREFLLSHQLFFREDLTMNEDGYWFFSIFQEASSFCCLDAVLYHYRVGNSTSAVGRAPTLGSYYGDWTTYSHWYHWFRDHYQGKAGTILAGRMARGYVNSASAIYALSREEREKAIGLFSQHLDILPHSSRKSHRILYGIYRLWGVRAYLRACHLALGVKQRLKRRG